jgi:hypothetical protein
MDIRLIFDFLNDIEIREDPKTGTITNSVIVMVSAAVIQLTFVAIVITSLFF